MKTHHCEKYKNLIKEVGELGSEKQHYMFGNAITDSIHNFEDSKFWWIDNDEYASPILFCPFCGLELKTLLDDAYKITQQINESFQ